MIKKMTAFLMALLIAVSLSACAAADNKMNNEDDGRGDIFYEDNESIDDNPDDYADDVTDDDTSADLIGEKVAKEATITLNVKEYEKAVKDLYAKIKSDGGYVEYSEDNSPDAVDVYANMEVRIRIPADKYSEFLKYLEELGKISYKSESSQSLTYNYIDVQARLTVLKKQEERLLEILKSAQSVSEVLEVEDKLSDVRTQIEQYTQTMDEYDNRIEYSTIALMIVNESNRKQAKESFLDRIKDAFSDSINAFVDVFQFCVIAVVWMLPYIACVAVIVAIVLICIKIVKNKNKKQ